MRTIVNVEVRAARAARGRRAGTFALAAILTAAAAAAGLLAGAAPAGAAALVEDFESDPFAPRAGRPAFERRGPLEAFAWEPETPPAFEGDAPGSLRARYDSLEPTARALVALPRALGAGDDFEVSAVFAIRAEGFTADPFGFAQISFGLMNRSTTGDDRTGEISDFRADTFDTLEFDHFPNVSPFFGGPFTGAAAFGGAAGDDAFTNFAFASVTLALPLGEPVEARLVHRAGEREVEVSVARVLPDGAREALLPAPVRVATGGLDPGFALDALGVFAYHDGFNEFAESGRSLRADVDYHLLAVGFESPIPVSARILPDPLFVSTRSRFVRARLAPLSAEDAGALSALAGEAPSVELWHGSVRLAAALRAEYDPEAGELAVLFDAVAVLAGLGDARGEVEIRVRGGVEGADRVFVLGTASGSGGHPGRRRDR